MTIVTQCQELAAIVDRYTQGKGDGFHPTAIEALEFQRVSSASTLCGVCNPILGILLQGKKEALLGEERYQYGASQYLVVSVDLPLTAFVVEATPEKPYLGFKLSLDPKLLCDLISAQPTEIKRHKENSVRGLFVNTADEALLDNALRLTKLLDTPQDIAILAPLIIREIHYRLLRGEQAESVRQIATLGSQMHRIAQVIQFIKTNFTLTLRVEHLAEQANMSPSSFHDHFKGVTSMTPLQYQKQLRLLEARRLMLAEDSDAAKAAYQVGYESPSQFSREYSRFFGAPPFRDIQRLRSA
jgi:AraC-like DNA-binding protein